MIGGFYKPGDTLEMISHEEAIEREAEMKCVQKEAQEKIARNLISMLADVRKEFAKKIAEDIMSSMKDSEVFQTAKTKITEHLETTMKKIAEEGLDSLLLIDHAEKIMNKKHQKDSD